MILRSLLILTTPYFKNRILLSPSFSQKLVIIPNSFRFTHQSCIKRKISQQLYFQSQILKVLPHDKLLGIQRVSNPSTEKLFFSGQTRPPKNCFSVFIYIYIYICIVHDCFSSKAELKISFIKTRLEM